MARPDTWTKEELNILKTNYPTAEWDFLLSKIDKRKDQIISKASKLGLKRATSFSSFTKEEDDLIKSFWSTCSEEEFVDKYMPYRTTRSIQTRASRLGVRRVNQWTSLEDKTLINNYYSMSINDLSILIPNHTINSIKNRIRKLELTGGSTYKYTDGETKFIKDNYLTMSDDEIGKVLHRAGQSVKEYRRKLRLYKPKPDNVIYALNTFVHRHNYEWKMKSARNCNYKCVVTNDNFDDVHHLYSRNMILNESLADTELLNSYNVNNLTDDIKDYILNKYLETQSKYPLGVCLRHDIHKQFHDMYGYGDNTPEQFYEFISDLYPDKLSYIKNLA